MYFNHKLCKTAPARVGPYLGSSLSKLSSHNNTLKEPASEEKYHSSPNN